MKKLYLIALILLITGVQLRADHNSGGKVSWQCIKSGANAGKYKFQLYLYRYCEGIDLLPSTSLQSNSPLGTIPMNRIGIVDISPDCYLGDEIDCYDPNKDSYAIEQHLYESAFVTLMGIPPVTGWQFTWSSCCRPAPALYGWGFIVDNLEPQNQSYQVKAVMYPYNGQNANPCFDSSPIFAEVPASIICTKYKFNYNHNAVDEEKDSLVYEFAPAFQSSGASVGYATHLNTSQVTPRANGGNFIVPSPGFSYLMPLPWPHANMNINNIAASINPSTGEISFLSHNPGSFATGVKVDAYKCGIRVASIYIDIPVFMIDCAPLPPPFSSIYNIPPVVTFTKKGGVTTPTLNVSVLAGEYVEFDIQGTDGGLLPGLVPQTISITPSGVQYGAFFADSTAGCPDPPCAVLDTSNVYYSHVTKNWKGQSLTKTRFKWKSDCNHLAQSQFQGGTCFIRSNVYTFLFKVLDNYCPAPGANFVTASITINAPDPIDPPKLKCLSILPNGDVHLTWDVPVPEALDTSNSFRKYIIFRASTRGAATYTAIDTITVQDQSDYVDVGANAITSPKFYFIMGVSSCNDQSRLIRSDTLGTPTLTGTAIASGDTADLDWNDYLLPGTFPSSAIGQYYIWQIYNNDTLLIDSTTTSSKKVSLNSCIGVKLCHPSNVSYFVEVRDTTLGWECSAYSNTIPLVVGDNTPPVSPVTVVASIDSVNGNTHLDWSLSVDCDAIKYYIYENGVLIDSVDAPGTSYTVNNPTGDPYNIPPKTYTISSTDSCGNNGITGLAHTTMETKVVGSGVVRCDIDKKIPITFGAYDGWPVAQYILYADSGTGFYPIATFNPPFTFPITYNHTQVGNHFYRYRVRGYDGSGTFTESSHDSITMFIVDATVIAAPDPRCINVTPNGNIRIDWIKPVNTSGNFDSYIIEHSTNGTSFTVLDSITGSSRSDNSAWDSTGYTHVGPNMGVKHYYRIYSRSGCYGYTLSPSSAVIQLLQLEIDPIDPTINQLSWYFKPLPTSLNYVVKKEYPVGTGLQNFLNLSNTATSAYDTIITCKDTALYQVTIEDASGCTSSSQVKEGVFNDDIPPAKQFLDSVSVIDDTSAIMGWKANPSPDVQVYYLIRKTGSTYVIEDTLSAGQLSYVNAGLKGCYAVVPADSCGNDRLALADFDYHCTINMDAAIDRCDQSFVLEWNPYTTFKSGTQVRYEIFVSLNNTEFTSLGFTNDTRYRFSNPVTGNNYCFYVRATENNGNGPFTSTSDSTCLTANFLIKPEYAYLQHVTVIDSNEIELSVWVDLRADVSEYLIKRGTDSLNMNVIKTILAPKIPTYADSTLKFVDIYPRTSLKPYYYKVEVVDPCGDIVETSNLARSILLKVEANNESKSNHLDWTDYLRWESGVHSYKVYRSSDGNYKYQTTIQAASQKTSYIDDVSDLVEKSEGLFCYYVEATEREPFFPGLHKAETSRSNEVCVIQYPLFYIPTAFTPGAGNSPGLNDVFKPEGVFVSFEDYSFEVYNRWGEKVFSTNNFEEGWDGNVEGKPAETGVYTYFIKYRGVDSRRTYEQKGNVTIAK